MDAYDYRVQVWLGMQKFALLKLMDESTSNKDNKWGIIDVSLCSLDLLAP